MHKVDVNCIINYAKNVKTDGQGAGRMKTKFMCDRCGKEVDELIGSAKALRAGYVSMCNKCQNEIKKLKEIEE
jgi:hypothetical protein